MALVRPNVDGRHAVQKGNSKHRKVRELGADERFAEIGFEEFRQFALDDGLSQYERIGFPDSYREGFEPAIFADIREKLDLLDDNGLTVLDIGPGCSDMPNMLIEHCQRHSHRLYFIDSEEMLSRLPDAEGVTKVAAMYPRCPEFLAANLGRFDVILCYSVLHYLFVEVEFFRFLDETLSLLAPGGQFLIGDIPNFSKRKRFFASEAGRKFHRSFTDSNSEIAVEFNRIDRDKIDDSIIMMLLQRSRQSGFDAYVLPQGRGLPMANRREDILITRP